MVFEGFLGELPHHGARHDHFASITGTQVQPTQSGHSRRPLQPKLDPFGMCKEGDFDGGTAGAFAAKLRRKVRAVVTDPTATSC